MELINFIDYVKLNKNDNLVAALGEFDCFHLAHQKLINKTIEIAKELKYKSAVITFDPHPFEIIKKQKIQISSLMDKENYLKNLNIDYLIVIDFDEQTVKLSPKDFIDNYLLKLNLKIAIAGFDFSFGYKGEGKISDIEKLSNGLIKTVTIEEQKHNGNKIGSTLIRKMLLEGDIKNLDSILGHKLSLLAKVIKGHGIGHTIGVPTANLEFFGHLCLKEGVYAVKVKYQNNIFPAMLNVGHNESFNKYNNLSYEVHIINFNSNLYDEVIEVIFYDYVRSEIHFDSIEDFKKQIEIDKNKIIFILLE